MATELELVGIVHRDGEDDALPSQSFRVRHAYYGPVLEWLDDAGEAKATAAFDYCNGEMQVLVFDNTDDEPVARVPLAEDGSHDKERV